METTIHLGNLVSVKDLDITDRLADEDLYIDAIDEAIAEIKRLRYRIIELEAAQQSVHPTSACCRAEIIPGIRHGEPSLCANCGGTCGLRKPLGAL